MMRCDEVDKDDDDEKNDDNNRNDNHNKNRTIVIDNIARQRATYMQNMIYTHLLVDITRCKITHPMTLSHCVCWRSISSSYAHTCCTQWLQMLLCGCMNEAQQNAQCAARRSLHRTHCVCEQKRLNFIAVKFSACCSHAHPSDMKFTFTPLNLQWNSLLTAVKFNSMSLNFAMKFISTKVKFTEFCSEIHFNGNEIHCFAIEFCSEIHCWRPGDEVKFTGSEVVHLVPKSSEFWSEFHCFCAVVWQAMI